MRTARLLDGGRAVNQRHTHRVIPASTASTVQSILEGVVRIGSGKRASLGPDIMVAGKTGTTENYGDAWFVGWTPRYTVAVWVGYPDSVKAMEPPTFSFQGEPVAGGTYPAAIWGSFMRTAMTIYERRHPDSADALRPQTSATPGAATPAPQSTGGVVATPAPPAPSTPSTTTPSTPAAPEDTTPAQPAPDTQAPAGGTSPPAGTGDGTTGTGTGTTGTGTTGTGTGTGTTGTGGTGGGTGAAGTG